MAPRSRHPGRRRKSPAGPRAAGRPRCGPPDDGRPGRRAPGDQATEFPGPLNYSGEGEGGKARSESPSQRNSKSFTLLWVGKTGGEGGGKTGAPVNRGALPVSIVHAHPPPRRCRRRVVPRPTRRLRPGRGLASLRPARGAPRPGGGRAGHPGRAAGQRGGLLRRRLLLGAPRRSLVPRRTTTAGLGGGRLAWRAGAARQDPARPVPQVGPVEGEVRQEGREARRHHGQEKKQEHGKSD